MTTSTQPTVGRIVQYTLSDQDVAAIDLHRQAGPDSGNIAYAGDTYPLLVTRVWPDSINGQVFLDGNDTLWVTSRYQGDAEGQWHWTVRTDVPQLSTSESGITTTIPGARLISYND